MARTDRVDTASRLIGAPPEAIYGAFADADALARWLPPANMRATIQHFDFREGGGYRMRLSYTDAADGPGKSGDGSDGVEVVFTGLVEGRRIEQTVRFDSPDAAFAGT